MNKRSTSTRALVLGAILTALVILLQFMGSFIRLGPFSISLVLIPIVIGAATCGVGVATWLGFAFGFAVLISGDAAAFLAVTVPGTVITVLSKGMLCGLLSALTYKGVSKLCKSELLSVIASAIVCPVVNTGVFLICCSIFFMETLRGWAAASGVGGDVVHYMIFVLVGANFIVELITNIILSPVATRLIEFRKKN